MRLALVIALSLIAAPTAHAGDDERVVVVNAAAELGTDDAGQVARLRQALEARGLLQELPRRVEEALEGNTTTSIDTDAIKDAWAEFDYDGARDLIDEQEARVLEGDVSGDPAVTLAEIEQWRGIIAAAQDDPGEAVTWFQAAYRLNPGLTIDKRYASPHVRALVKKARRSDDETGLLDIDVDPEDARVAIDGGEARPIDGKLRLAAGVHLVMLTAAGRAPYGELIQIRGDHTEGLQIVLDPETRAHRTARLVDATAAAAPGKARLKRARALARATGAERILVVEEGGDDHVTIRLYNIAEGHFSKPVELSGRASSAAIASLVSSALEAEGALAPARDPEPRAWYRRWYVWAGAAAVLAGGVAYHEWSSRDLTSIRGL